VESFPVGDQPARGYLALPPETSRPVPAVLVLHAWWGLNDTITHICDRFAAEGFIAFAPDLFEGRSTTVIAEAERLAQGGDEARMRAIALAALSFLRTHPAARPDPVAVVGLSFGAAWAYELSSLRPDDVRAVVAFYGTYGGLDFTSARATYLGHFAEDDPFEPLPVVKEFEETIRAAGRTVTFHTYPKTKHWFFEPDRPDAYHAAAAALAWERTLAFLHQSK
jgi:carboxymethylenebutenolidase